jgi:CDP-glucose 4,6-dehydratase
MNAAPRRAGTTALVTGAHGFIGSWIAERLLAEGARVVVPRGHGGGDSRFVQDGLDSRCDVVDADLLDLTSLIRLVNEYEVDTVFHLGAKTIVVTATRSPLATWEANVQGTYNLLEACRLAAGDSREVRVVVASSYHAYGHHDGRPYREDFALKATRPYEVSKACADMLARCYAETWDMPVAVTRLANVYGGGDLDFSRLLPDAARALFKGERPVIRSDGTPERDFLYVDDAVDAYMAIADSLERAEFRGRAWNAGSGTSVAVVELVRGLISASGKELEPEVQLKPRPGHTDRQALDSTAARDELGWHPRWDLGSALRETYAWYERNLG